MKKKIEIETPAFNPKLHGKPWIARVDFTDKANGEFSWGEWVGDARNGSVGLLILAANPGDIVARGQKDHQNPRNSAAQWFKVGPALDLIPLAGGVVEAFRLFKTELISISGSTFHHKVFEPDLDRTQPIQTRLSHEPRTTED